jgi:hypothetical protein
LICGAVPPLDGALAPALIGGTAMNTPQCAHNMRVPARAPSATFASPQLEHRNDILAAIGYALRNGPSMAIILIHTHIDR